MKTTLYTALVFVLLGLSACKQSCPDCVTPPTRFIFEMTDMATGENLFTNGTYQSADFRVVNAATQADSEFDFVTENNLNLVVVSNIGWKTEVVTLEFYQADKKLFALTVDVSRNSDGCCDYSVYNKVDIAGADFDYSSATGFFTILIDPDNQ